jgi:hypothetical protein
MADGFGFDSAFMMPGTANSPWDPLATGPQAFPAAQQVAPLPFVNPTSGGLDLSAPAPTAGPPGEATDTSGDTTGAKKGFSADKLVQGLRGASAPPRPDVVKPTSPGLPRQVPIQSGQFLQLLNSLSNPRVPPARPGTLGGALGIGRY